MQHHGDATRLGSLDTRWLLDPAATDDRGAADEGDEAEALVGALPVVEETFGALGAEGEHHVHLLHVEGSDP
jgi:hypothetical protein